MREAWRCPGCGYEGGGAGGRCPGCGEETEAGRRCALCGGWVRRQEGAGERFCLCRDCLERELRQQGQSYVEKRPELLEDFALYWCAGLGDAWKHTAAGRQMVRRVAERLRQGREPYPGLLAAYLREEPEGFADWRAGREKKEREEGYAKPYS